MGSVQRQTEVDTGSLEDPENWYKIHGQVYGHFWIKKDL
jgi:hypothetical protein